MNNIKEKVKKMKLKVIKRKFTILLLISVIFTLNFVGSILFNTSIVFAADATDYDFTDELEEDISRKLEIYSELIFREYVNIPFCLCLI